MHSPKCIQTPSSLLSNNMASLVTIFLILLSSFSASAQSDDSQYQNCSSTFKCGSLEESLWYPFWSDPRPQYCGHPDFKLSCPQSGSKDSSTATIKIGSQMLKVVNISMNDQSMTLLWPADPCPHSPSNIALAFDGISFNYSSGVKNVTFSYNCSSYESEASFTCPKSGYLGGMTAYYATDPVSKDVINKCEVNVVVPMLERGVEKMGSDYLSVVEGLKEGFEVDWFGLEGQGYCKSCVSSGGACGYNWISNAPVCFCKVNGVCNISGSSFGNIAPSDGDTYNTNALSSPPPPPPGTNDSKRPIIIGVGVGAALFATAILASAAFIFYGRRDKMPHQALATAVSRPRNGPLDPSALSNLESGDSFLGVSLFNYDELEEATEYFNPSKELGEGGFGTVYHGKLGDGREVAIKRMFENNSKRVQQFMNEIEILTHLRHKNLVTLYGCTSRHSQDLLLVYEYVPNGTVADHLRGGKSRLSPNTEFSPLSWSTRLSIAVETSSALVYLHASDIIHRDVKTNNILLDNHSSVKVADFGLSRLFPLDLTHVSTAPQGTPGYVDPEYHQCYQLTDKSDVYSFGVVLVELISTKPAVDITRQRHEINLSNHAINKIQNDALDELVDPTLGFDVDARVKEEVTMVAELAFQCLQHDRDMRPTMDEVLEVLTRIQEHKDHNDKIKKINYMGSIKAEVVDIPVEEALRLKSDLSPGSSIGSKGKIHDTTS